VVCAKPTLAERLAYTWAVDGRDQTFALGAVSVAHAVPVKQGAAWKLDNHRVVYVHHPTCEVNTKAAIVDNRDFSGSQCRQKYRSCKQHLSGSAVHE
jgi:hypothetical protein